MDNYDPFIVRHPLLTGVITLLVLTVAIVAGYAIKYYTADVRGRVEANEQIKSGSNRIAQYDHFFNLCASIQGNEAQIDALLDEQDGSDPGTNRDRIRASISGVTAARSAAIAQYNADASKDYTDGQFLASNLPYQLPSTTYQKGYRTKCAS